MKIKQLLVLLAALCAIATEVGCVSAERQMSQSSFDAMNLKRDEKLSPTEFSQPLMLQSVGLNTNGPITLDEWQRYDRSAWQKEDFSAFDVNGDGQINATEFLTQTPKASKRYHFFGDPGKTNRDYPSRDKEEFQPEGLQLFSIHF